MLTDYELVIGASLRYALPRSTYITEVVASYIYDEADKLGVDCIKYMIKDITEAESGFSFIDQPIWNRLKNKLQSVLNSKSTGV